MPQAANPYAGPSTLRRTGIIKNRSRRKALVGMTNTEQRIEEITNNPHEARRYAKHHAERCLDESLPAAYGIIRSFSADGRGAFGHTTRRWLKNQCFQSLVATRIDPTICAIHKMGLKDCADNFSNDYRAWCSSLVATASNYPNRLPSSPRDREALMKKIAYELETHITQLIGLIQRNMEAAGIELLPGPGFSSVIIPFLLGSE